MSDIISRNKAIDIVRTIHPDYDDIDSINTERPDIQFRRHNYGVEVTRAYSKHEGLFYAGKNRALLEDTNIILDRVLSAISKKTQKAPGYMTENPWLEKLGLAVIVGYPLGRSDLEIIIGQLSVKTKAYYSEFYFVTPDSSYFYDGRKLIEYTA